MTWAGPRRITGRPWTWPARSAAPGMRLTRWPAWAAAPWPPADTADAKASLRQAQEIFQRIGAAEAAGVAAELDALSTAGPAR